ncbi:L,D-transpeptidase family protein [Vibrio sp. TH_r3]|uniref:L,D-transpeptidase family protein n=1 Tax=Vibrio sp. TH_r3 TaxID=3082084 RepID=UPI0029542703|nr:L,D-transpeptidase family protein [Vibrio sp. TH_r3]MDV7103277.1 L,D-transpeptidase family protein [Vibrio sp. TH_r3]
MFNYLILLFLFFVFPVYAASYELPSDGSRLVGRVQNHMVEAGETMAEIAKRYDVGFLSLMAANKGIDPFLPQEGTVLVIPSMFILPSDDREGIVINLAELRLYYFDQDKKHVHVFPVGIGRIGRDTPEMSSYISQKIKDPTWTPTQNIRNEYLEKGIELPRVVPAGPNNPLGLFALRLAYGVGDYLIHGTNKDFGIGLRVSSGCIRLEPQDIEWLFNQVQRKEKVRVLNKPVKMTMEPDSSVFIEVHEPLTRSNGDKKVLVLPENLEGWMDEFNLSKNKARAAIAIQSGVPTQIVQPY